MIEKPAILGGEPTTKRKIPLYCICTGEEEKEAIIDAFNKKAFASGEFIKKLEDEFARFIGTKHALAVSNGTDGLFLAYLAYGLTFGKKIITTPLTFVATASTIVHTGAIPVFCDVELDGNISPMKIQELVKSENIDGISIVHLYGKPVEMKPIMELAKENNIVVIEDASHAHGAEYNGKKVGSIGDIGVFSLYPSKVIAAGGWGGLITTNDDEIAEKIILLRGHGELKNIIGKKGAYKFRILGYNFRMNNMEAAVAYYQLKKIDSFIEKRRKNAKLLSELLRDVPGITIPEEKPHIKHIFYLYAIVLDDKITGWSRDEFVEALNAEGIEAQPGYVVPLHKQEVFLKLNDPNVNHFAKINKYPDYSKMRFPNAEYLSNHTIWLPTHPCLKEEDVENIAKAIKKLISWKKNR